MSSFCKPKKHRSIANTNGKCGEITYHLQVGKRVYVLNCLFCPQIQIQWDNFINHMEQEHDEELDQLLQKASRSKSSSKEHTVTAIPSFAETSKSTNEFEDNCQLSKVEVNCDPLVIAGTDNLAPISTIKAETYEFVDQSFEIPAEVTAEKHDQTHSTLDEEFLNRNNENETSTRSCAEQIQNLDCDDNNKTLQTAESCDLVISEINLKEILNLKGQNVLAYYKTNNCLDTKTRRILCDLIIDTILDRGWKMRSKDIPYIAEKIIQVFPTEDRLQYFVPRQTNNNRTPTGFLYHRYYNRMKRIMERPIIKRRYSKKTTVI